MKKEFTITVTVPFDVSFRDIERALNQLDAETELFDIKELEENDR